MIITTNNKKITIEIEFENNDELKCFKCFLANSDESEIATTSKYKTGAKLANEILEKIGYSF